MPNKIFCLGEEDILVKQAKILVLEDDPHVREILSQVLEDEDYFVVAVENGERAVQAAGDQAFDLIVADIRMDGMGGLEAIEQTRAFQPAIGTLVVSAYADPRETARASAMKVGAYLRKPFRMEEFLQQVRAQLATRTPEPGLQTTVNRVSALTLLQQTLSRLDEGGRKNPPGTLRRAEFLVEKLSLKLGLTHEVQTEIACACAFALSVSGEFASENWDDSPQLMATFRSTLAFLDEPYDQDPAPPLEARLAALVVFTVRQESRAGSLLDLRQVASDELVRAAILEEGPGLDPALVDLYLQTRKRHEGEPAPSAGVSKNEHLEKVRGLLALAQAMRSAGKSSEAISAYRAVLARCPAGAEFVTSSLALAALQPESAVTLLHQACQDAARRGPLVAAQTALEAGHLLYAKQPTEAHPYLTQAARSLSKLGLDNAWSRAILPLTSLGVSIPARKFPLVLRGFLRVEDHQETQAMAGRLLPLLLEAVPADPDDEVDRLLALLGSRFFPTLKRCVNDGSLSEKALLRLVSGLKQSGGIMSPELVALFAGSERESVVQAARELRLQLDPQAGRSAFLRVQSFGPLALYIDDERLDPSRWRTQKVRLLFAYLAARWGQRVPEDTLIDLFWPKSSEKGQQRVYWATSTLRAALSTGQGSVSPLERDNSTLCLLSQTPHWHDFEDFHQLHARALALRSEGDSSGTRVALRRLSRLYKAPYLDGCYMDWALSARETLERQLVDSLVLLAQLSLEAEENREAMEAAEHALTIDGCRQDAALIGMQAGINLGQPERAIEIFERTERELRVDYALEPSTDLLRVLYQARMGQPDVRSTEMIG